MKIDHIGIAVTDLQQAAGFYGTVLGFEDQGGERVEEQKVKVRFFKVGESRFELLEPTAEDSSISRFLQTRGPGIHHIALRVRDLEACLADLQKQGVRLIDTKPRKGAHGTRIAFVHPQSTGGVLLELCE